MDPLNRLLSCIKTDHVCIQTHRFPDPDAIGCAYALQELLKEYNITSEIYYGGLIEKKLLVEYLGVEMKNTDELEAKPEFDTVIYVDSQAGNSNSPELTGNVSLCIDHHQKFNDLQYAFEDIRPTYGACATMLTRYFLENRIPISKKTATGLIYGIQVDVNNFTRGTTAEDIEAFRALFPLCDQHILNELHHSRYSRKGIEAYAHSFSHMDFRDGVCFVDVGPDCPDALAATISDFVLAIDEVNVALVYTKRKTGIKFSMRSASTQYDTGILMYAVLHELGTGGGHAFMSGGFIPNQAETDMDALIEQVKDKLVWLVKNICG